jgi:hypothetical protein
VVHFLPIAFMYKASLLHNSSGAISLDSSFDLGGLGFILILLLVVSSHSLVP